MKVGRDRRGERERKKEREDRGDKGDLLHTREDGFDI